MRRSTPTTNSRDAATRVAIVGLSMGGGLTAFIAEAATRRRGLRLHQSAGQGPRRRRWNEALRELIESGVETDGLDRLGHQEGGRGRGRVRRRRRSRAPSSLFDAVPRRSTSKLRSITAPSLLFSSREDHVGDTRTTATSSSRSRRGRSSESGSRTRITSRRMDNDHELVESRRSDSSPRYLVVTSTAASRGRRARRQVGPPHAERRRAGPVHRTTRSGPRARERHERAGPRRRRRDRAPLRTHQRRARRRGAAEPRPRRGARHGARRRKTVDSPCRASWARRREERSSRSPRDVQSGRRRAPRRNSRRRSAAIRARNEELNVFLYVDEDGARAGGRVDRRTRRPRRGRRSARGRARSRSRTTSVRSGIPTTCSSQDPRGMATSLQRHRRRSTDRRRCGPRGQDQPRRVRHGIVDRELRVRARRAIPSTRRACPAVRRAVRRPRSRPT